MKIKITLMLLSLIFYSAISLSAESDIARKTDSRLLNMKDFNNVSERKVIADIRKEIKFKKLNDSGSRFNKTEYKMKDDCNTLLSADDCVSFNLLSIGLADSYIGEYSVFAVIGTGIRLSEEQIESFNGIDD